MGIQLPKLLFFKLTKLSLKDFVRKYMLKKDTSNESDLKSL